jgi:single-stranded-DNA-specific exonuclease
MTSYSLRREIPLKVKNELKKYPELLQNLLFARGIDNDIDAQKFLNPSYEGDLYDPFLMHDMKKAVERVLLAIKDKEKICIFSDYDADGIPGGVLLKDFFTKIGYLNFFNYIPDRHFEGYGLSLGAIEKVKSMGAEVIISVDCGIVDFEPADKARELEIDLIITDHHLPADRLPSAYAVVNPKIGESYPDKMLCGAGVAFKLVQAILKTNDFGLKAGWEKWLLDMAGLSTIADMVPLQNENRALSFFGMQVLRKSPRLGLLKLLRKLKIEQRTLSEDDLAFMIVPRINAASRMDDPMKAFNLLSTTSEDEAEVLATELNKINDERKGVVASMVKEIHHKQERFVDKKIIVVGNPNWRPGLLGLVANSVMEHYNKPTFIWGRDGSEGIKGSCRSDGSVDVVELMSSSAVFYDYGGHKLAGGFSLTAESVHSLETEIELAYEKTRNKEFTEEVVEADGKLTLSDINLHTFKLVDQLAPFGIGNPKPLFIVSDVTVNEIKQFGKTANHLSLTLKDDSNRKVKAISFFSEPVDFKKEPKVGDKINLAGHLEKSNFNGFTELRLRIVEIY